MTNTMGFSDAASQGDMYLARFSPEIHLRRLLQKQVRCYHSTECMDAFFISLPGAFLLYTTALKREDLIIQFAHYFCRFITQSLSMSKVITRSLPHSASSFR